MQKFQDDIFTILWDILKGEIVKNTIRSSLEYFFPELKERVRFGTLREVKELNGKKSNGCW